MLQFVAVQTLLSSISKRKKIRDKLFRTGKGDTQTRKQEQEGRETEEAVRFQQHRQVHC